MNWKTTYLPSLLLGLFMLLLPHAAVVGQTTLASWPFTTSGTDAPTGVDANITASAFSMVGVTISTAGSSISASNWATTTTVDAGKYFQVSIAPKSGYNLNLSAITFDERRSGTGIRNYEVRWSKQSDFSTSTSLAVVSVPDNTNQRAGDLTGLNIDVNDGETIYIRWYGYAAEATTGTWRLTGTPTIEGTVTQATSSTSVAFTSASATVGEASGTYDLTLGITNPDATNATQVEVALTSGSAADINGYATQTVTFPAGSSADQTITLTITDDALVEGDEALTFTLQNPSGGNSASIGTQSTFDLTITDDDTPPATEVAFMGASASTAEESGTYDLTFSIANPSATVATTVQVALTTGTAADINGYTTQTVTFPAGSSANQTLTVNITDDADIESAETLTFTLQNVSGGESAILGTQTTFNLTIQASDLPNAWINEFHYDNNGTDVDEFVEIVVENAGSYAASNFVLHLYNGNDGKKYSEINLAGGWVSGTPAAGLFTVSSNTIGSYTYYVISYPSNGIQNGPDGLALSYSNALIQFLSYEGSAFAGTDGVANGATSTAIGVSEPGTDAAGSSLQLIGTGTRYSNFTWSGPIANTLGEVNDGQAIGTPTTSVAFAGSTGTVGEGAGTYVLAVAITNADAGNATQVQLALTSGSDADVDTYATQTLTFPAGSSASQTVTLAITDDGDFEGNEMLTFTLQNVSGGASASIGTPSAFQLTIADNESAAPAAAVSPATAISTTTATLNGQVSSNGASTTVTFKYGTTSGGPYDTSIDATQSPLASSAANNSLVSASIAGLTNGVTYYYIIEATNANGTVASAAEASFTTGAAAKIIISEVADVDDIDAEYVEIYNAGTADESLKDWMLVQDGGAYTTTFNTASVTTNMDADFTLKPGEYVVVFRGTLADAMYAFPNFGGYYMTTGSTATGAPSLNGAEYFDLQNSSGSPVDHFSASGSASISGRLYERNDANQDGTSLASHWANFDSGLASPGQSNATSLSNDDSGTVGDTRVNLSVTTNSIGETGSAAVTITATASAAVSATKAVGISLSGVGISSADYTLSSTSIFIPAGQTSGSVTLHIEDDGETESKESLVVEIASVDAGLQAGNVFYQIIDINDALAAVPGNLCGADLRDWLRDNWHTGKHVSLGYDRAREQMYRYVYREANDQVYCHYTGFSQSPSFTTYLNPINAEHVIPQSRFAEEAVKKADVHHLFPVYENVNSARNNHPFAELDDDTQTTAWYTVNGTNTGFISQGTKPTSNLEQYSELGSISGTTHFEPLHNRKGNVARAIFYFFATYGQITGSDAVVRYINDICDVNTLYSWHLSDPVDEQERLQNSRVADVQGNRNPFIDYPELVGVAWHDYITSVSNPCTSTFYAKASSNLNDLASWSDVADGTGSAPAAFANDGQIFVINNASGVLAADLTISGASTQVQIGDGVAAASLTVPSGIALTLPNLEVLANATLVLESGATLNITGNFENYGSIAADAGSSVALNGSLAQTISGSNNFGNLAINNANGVELAGATTVARLLNLQAGTLNTNGNLTLASDINGTAMVGFNGGGIAGQATVQRYMPDNSGEGWWQGTGSIATAYYRYFGSPVQGAYVGGFDAPSFTLEVSNASMFNSNWNQAIAPFPNFYMYDESRLVGGGDETFAKGWMVPTAATVLQPGEGFIANIADEEAASITGTLNTSDVTVNGITDGGLANSGWNLLGNPYAAPISADQFLADNSGMLDASVYVRMAVSQYGGTWQSRVNGISSPSGWDGTVGSMQGFFVKRKSGASGSSVTFSRNIASTSYTNPDFYRTKGQKEGVLRLALESNGHADEAVLYWEAGATEQFDSQFDALKVQYNPAGWPTLFAKAAGGEMQAIAGLPAGEQIVALGLWIPADGQHSFKVSSLDGFATSMDILLEDKANGQLIDLRKQSAYAFEAKKGMAEGRFAIHFKPAQVTGLEGEFVAFEAYSAGKTIYVRPGQSGAQLHQVALFDLAGRQVWSAAVQGGNQAMQWQTQLPKGIYVLKLTHSQGQQARRIPIE